MKNAELYQSVVDTLRRWNKNEPEAGGFHTVGSPAHSLYPNIAAEFNSSDMFMCTVSEYANVTPHIMAAIIEAGESMTLREVRGLAGLWRCSIDYLFSPELSVISDERKRMLYIKEIEARLQSLGDFKSAFTRNVPFRYRQIKAGGPVTYACYRNTILALEFALGEMRRSATHMLGVDAQG